MQANPTSGNFASLHVSCRHGIGVISTPFLKTQSDRLTGKAALPRWKQAVLCKAAHNSSTWAGNDTERRKPLRQHKAPRLESQVTTLPLRVWVLHGPNPNDPRGHTGVLSQRGKRKQCFRAGGLCVCLTGLLQGTTLVVG